MLLIECPDCDARYNVNPGNTNKQSTTIKCPACEHIFTIALSDGTPIPGKAVAKSRQKVLIVDDARAFRNLLSDLLKPLDLDIITAANGNDAMQMILRERPNLVIIDLMLPDTSGAEIVSRIKSFKRLSATRFLILSSSILNDTPTPEVRDCGADDFSSKSFKPDRLLGRITSLLNK